MCTATEAPPVGVGATVQVHGRFTGTVAYRGSVSYAGGEFLGVVLQEPRGKNDGSVRGTRYFQCAPGHGIMVRPAEVTAVAW